MPALLLIAHGSRNAEANTEIRRLAERVEQRVQAEYDAVVPAFLELAEPTIQQGIDACVSRGSEQIDVVPYFLAAGNHVARDIPGELDSARQRHPETQIRLAPHIGGSQAMADLVVSSARELA